MNEQEKKWLEDHKDQRQRCEIWTRVMGYHRPLESFNAGKQSEYNDRKMFTESACACHLQQMA